MTIWSSQMKWCITIFVLRIFVLNMVYNELTLQKITIFNCIVKRCATIGIFVLLKNFVFDSLFVKSLIVEKNFHVLAIFWDFTRFLLDSFLKIWLLMWGNFQSISSMIGFCFDIDGAIWIQKKCSNSNFRMSFFANEMKSDKRLMNGKVWKKDMIILIAYKFHIKVNIVTRFNYEYFNCWCRSHLWSTSFSLFIWT